MTAANINKSEEIRLKGKRNRLITLSQKPTNTRKHSNCPKSLVSTNLAISTWPSKHINLWLTSTSYHFSDSPSLAKTLKDLLTTYVPQNYSLRSLAEFVDLLKRSERKGLLASLDVSNLFTNVSIERTFTILIGNDYENPELAPREFCHI